MIWIWTLLGAVLGAWGNDALGMALGALLGWVVGRQQQQAREIRGLQRQLAEWQRTGGTPAPEVASRPAAEPHVAAPTRSVVVEASVPPDPPLPIVRPVNAAPELASEPLPATPVKPGFNPFAAARNWLLGGNSVVRVGIVILFMGVAFLLKFAAEHASLPIEARFSGVALGAIAGLVLGWRLRQRRPAYALALQGAAVAVLYLTVFAAFRLYPLLPAGLAFGLLLAMVALSALLAVRQDSRALAFIGTSGGFLAPLLTSSGHGSHVALFSYYLLLNLGIVAIARYKAWRVLNVVGFVFTFGISSGWGLLQYRPELYVTTQPFLLLFFLIYVWVALLFANLRQASRPDYVDATIVFGTPIVGFGLQWRLVHAWAFGAAFSALVLAGCYLGLASWLQRRNDPRSLLQQAFTALGMIFATLAIPLALSAQWTTAAWALEAAGVVWIGLRQQQPLVRGFGYLMLLLAGLAAALALDRPVDSWLNGTALGCLLLALSSGFIALLLQRQHDHLSRNEQGTAPLALYWGLLWWLAGAYYNFNHLLLAAEVPAAGVLWLCLTALLLRLGAARWMWPQMAQPTLAWSLALVWHGLQALALLPHPASHGGWLAWPLALLMHCWLLRRNQQDQPTEGLALNHVSGAWLFVLLGLWQVAWGFGQLGDMPSSWPVLGWALVPAALLGLLPHPALQSYWPLSQWQRHYLWLAAAPLALLLYLWSFAANGCSDGSAIPLPYLPLLNPLDLAQATVWLMLWRWSRSPVVAPELAKYLSTSQYWSALGAGIFVWLNAILLRSFHHWGGVAFDFDAMWASLLVQAGLSLFWSLLALAAMLLATRRSWRGLWLSGAGLLGVVVLKLMLFDLSAANGVERIVSFIGVGLLMLVIGYVSPVPPKQEPIA